MKLTRQELLSSSLISEPLAARDVDLLTMHVEA
jgi:hypothetical protein